MSKHPPPRPARRKTQALSDKARPPETMEGRLAHVEEGSGERAAQGPRAGGVRETAAWGPALSLLDL